MEEEKNFYFQQATYLLIFLLGAGLVFGWYFYEDFQQKEFAKIEQEKKIQEIARQEKIEEEIERKKKVKKAFFDDVNLQAESVLVQEIETGEILYQKNSLKKQSIASLTKIMTAILALNDDSLQEIKINWSDLAVEGEYDLQANEVFSKNDLIDFMLIFSANDIAHALANIVEPNSQKFITKMNSLALKLDLPATFFFSETGLDVANFVGGSYSNAEDINKLLIYFFKNYPKRAQETAQAKTEICSSLICHQIRNTNILLMDYPEIIFSKTGYTDFSGGSLGMIIKINEKLYSIVILHSSKNGRFQDAQQLIEILKKIKS